MPKEFIEVRAEKAWFRNRIEFMVIQKSENGRTSVGRSITMQTIEEGEAFGDPTFSLRPDEAQAMMDELWRVGLRPSEGTGSAGSLAATERHLKDMQAIAMGLLRKDGTQV